jgi:hypothetical protein
MQEISEQLWLATVKMALEAKNKGVDVGEALALLRNAKSMLNEGRLDRGSHEAARQAEAMIQEAQREILIKAEAVPGFDEKWQRVIARVQQGEKIGEYPMGGSSFYPDLPRAGGWVRLPFNRKVDESRAREVAGKHGLGFRLHHEKHFILTGDKASIKKALKNLSDCYRGD